MHQLLFFHFRTRTLETVLVAPHLHCPTLLVASDVYCEVVKGIIRHTSKVLYAIRQSYYTPYVKAIIRHTSKVLYARLIFCSSHRLSNVLAYTLVSCIVRRRLMYCPTSSHVLSDVVSCIVQRRLMYCPTSSHVLSDVVSCIFQRLV